MNKRNYQKELDKLIERNQKEGKTPRLFLHACCAPCSSYVMEYLSQYFEITIFFYNPNIAPVEEYSHRVAEIRRLIGENYCGCVFSKKEAMDRERLVTENRVNSNNG